MNIEGDNMISIQLNLPKKIFSKLEFLANEKGIGTGDIMCIAFTNFLDYQEGLRSSKRLTELLDSIKA